MKSLEDRLIEEHGVWGELPDHPVEDWKNDVDNDDTREGYWAWVTRRLKDEEAAV